MAVAIRFLCGFFFVLVIFEPSFSNEVSSREMVHFPAGEFEMGSPKGTGKKNEYPNHKVYLDAYYLDKFEVTFTDVFELWSKTIIICISKISAPGLKGPMYLLCIADLYGPNFKNVITILFQYQLFNSYMNIYIK